MYIKLFNITQILSTCTHSHSKACLEERKARVRALHLSYGCLHLSHFLMTILTFDHQLLPASGVGLTWPVSFEQCFVLGVARCSEPLSALPFHVFTIEIGLGWVPPQAGKTWNCAYPIQLSLVLLKLGREVQGV